VGRLAGRPPGLDYFVDGKGSQSGLGSASLLLYFAITFTIQRLILQAREDQGTRHERASPPFQINEHAPRRPHDQCDLSRSEP
jgi:hypothetical protein